MISVKQFADILDGKDECFIYSEEIKSFAQSLGMVYVIVSDDGCICFYGAIEHKILMSNHTYGVGREIFIEKNRWYKYFKTFDINDKNIDSEKYIKITDTIITNIEHSKFKYKYAYRNEYDVTVTDYRDEDGIVFHIDNI